MEGHLLNCKLSDSVQEWIKKSLKIEDKEFYFVTIKDYFYGYKNWIPKNEKKLKQILDPTHSTKLLKYIAYDKFFNILNDINTIECQLTET